MANTHFQILRSRTTDTPSNLLDGEIAYSFLSEKLFIGDTVSGNIIKIGGEYYTNIIENASSEDVANTLVIRDSNGAANIILKLLDGGNF